ncbi:MAG: hypothetical protein MUC87_01580 [Bacteroidia bacterium]|jgi:hypothetical protein|nr:hypothetical protein [Bacteroidia bacterium]
MKKLLHTFLFAASLVCVTHTQAQTVCNANGNLFLYSNYDGGLLTLNVDVNIPNIHIGIVSYEYVRVAITGTYAGNVTQVYYAGFNSNGNNCNLQGPASTSITGAPNAAANIVFSPNVTLNNPNGYSSIICGYSCDTATSQGGCNTVDQIVDYFEQTLGSTLYSHTIQYGCWSSQAISLSSGGNCCIVPSGPTTSIQSATAQEISIVNNAGQYIVNLPEEALSRQVMLEIYDAQGKCVYRQADMATDRQVIISDIVSSGSGMLFVRASWANTQATAKLITTQ